jgi:hypothetical protein
MERQMTVLTATDQKVYRSPDGNFALKLESGRFPGISYWHIIVQDDAAVAQDGYRRDRSHDGYSYYADKGFEDVSDEYEYLAGKIGGSAIDMVRRRLSPQ